MPHAGDTESVDDADRSTDNQKSTRNYFFLEKEIYAPFFC